MHAVDIIGVATLATDTESRAVKHAFPFSRLVLRCVQWQKQSGTRHGVTLAASDGLSLSRRLRYGSLRDRITSSSSARNQ